MNHNNFVLIGVSGGPDSMALLHMKIKKNKNIIVAHVNYQVRKSSDNDEKIVTNFCLENNIKLEKIKTKKHQKKDGNFENWARVTRYNFFKQIYDKYNCKALYLGHNKDDLIETFYLQKQRKAIVEYYGIKDKNFIFDMIVKRPILNLYKEDVLKYCEKNKIPYGIDETNLSFIYERNKIRYQKVFKMTKKEKEKVVKNIKKLNENLEEENKIIKKFSYSNIQNKEIVISDLLKFNKEEQIMIVYDFIMNTYRKKLSISKNRIKDILKKIESSKPNIILWEEDGILLLKEYTKIINRKNLEEYNFLIDLPIKNITNKIFKLSLKGNSKNKVIMNKEHFPLSVKKIKEKNKKINKYFIKNKIPIFERENWPGLYDKNDELILVIDTDISYNKKVKYKDEKIIFFIERSD